MYVLNSHRPDQCIERFNSCLDHMSSFSEENMKLLLLNKPIPSFYLRQASWKEVHFLHKMLTLILKLIMRTLWNAEKNMS